jgi:excisionase family DNA binding protein
MAVSYDEYLTRDELSALIKVPKATIDYWVTTGGIPFSRLGRRTVRFSRARIAEFMKEREGVEFRHKSHKRRGGNGGGEVAD